MSFPSGCVLQVVKLNSSLARVACTGSTERKRQFEAEQRCCRGGGRPQSWRQSKSGRLDYTRRRYDKASLKFTTSNLHHMDSPNGARRLANAISFLINSAMLNHNGSHKNSWCDNQSAPKTFITIIFISWSKRQRQWGGWCCGGSF